MKNYIAIASISGAISVILGAFGAHALKKVLSVSELTSFETGVRYQIIHSLLLFFIVLIPFLTKSQKTVISNILIAGIIMFSGSIYLLTLQIIPAKFLWFVTPFGGLLLIVSWVLIAIYSISKNQ